MLQPVFKDLLTEATGTTLKREGFLTDLGK
jgi:hypothetical protein